MNSCKYLKIETHLRNTQVNTTVNKGIVKTCLIVDMVRKNWSLIVVTGCELHYFISVRFSFWVVANFSTAERFKYLFFTAMKIHTMARTMKKQNNFIFSSLATLTFQRCVSPLFSGMEQLYRHYYLICTEILSVCCLCKTVRLSVLFAHSPCTFISFCTII